MLKTLFTIAFAVFAVGLITLVVSCSCYVISEAEYTRLFEAEELPARAVTQVMRDRGILEGLVISGFGVGMITAFVKITTNNP
jgi:tetrahydromethanopterin S-methyltransferase subunit G